MALFSLKKKGAKKVTKGKAVKKKASLKRKVSKKKVSKKKRNPSVDASTVLNNVEADLVGHRYKGFKRDDDNELSFIGYLNGTTKKKVSVRVRKLQSKYEVSISERSLLKEKLITQEYVSGASHVRSVVTPTVLSRYEPSKRKQSKKRNPCKNPVGPVINKTKSYLKTKGYTGILQKGNVVRFKGYATDGKPRTIDARILEDAKGYFVEMQVSGQGFKGLKQWQGMVKEPSKVPARIYKEVKSDYKPKAPPIYAAARDRLSKKKPPSKLKKDKAYIEAARDRLSKKKLKKDKAIQIFTTARNRLAKNHPKMINTALILDPEARKGKRHYAYAKKESSGVVVGISPELLLMPIKVIRGVIYHELGHAMLMHGCVKYGKDKTYYGKERRADVVAEKYLTKIYYNEYMLQEAGPGAKGKLVRPKGLK